MVGDGRADAGAFGVHPDLGSGGHLRGAINGVGQRGGKLGWVRVAVVGKGKGAGHNGRGGYVGAVGVLVVVRYGVGETDQIGGVGNQVGGAGSGGRGTGGNIGAVGNLKHTLLAADLNGQLGGAGPGDALGKIRRNGDDIAGYIAAAGGGTVGQAEGSDGDGVSGGGRGLGEEGAGQGEGGGEEEGQGGAQDGAPAGHHQQPAGQGQGPTKGGGEAGRHSVTRWHCGIFAGFAGNAIHDNPRFPILYSIRGSILWGFYAGILPIWGDFG